MTPQEFAETQKRIIDTIVANTREAIIITDIDRNVTHFNHQAQEITGYSTVETLDKPIESFLNLCDAAGESLIGDCCPTGNIDMNGTFFDKKELKLITKNNDARIVNVKSLKVKGGSELNLGCIIFIENTFQQSELERMKLDFVSMAEHVLRTPITIIRGYLSRLMEMKTLNKLDDSEVGYINNTFTATTELLALVEDLLSITEIQKDHLKLNLTLLDLESLIEKVVGEFKIIASKKGLKLTFIPPLYKIPMVHADVVKVKLVLHNLVDNAIKYTNEGSINVEIKKDEKFIQLAVSDTGRGIPQKNQSYLFSKFYRVKTALQMESGMGLGLYMSKKIIESQGGKIWVESTEGKGSVFYFTLPYAEEQAPSTLE